MKKPALIWNLGRIIKEAMKLKDVKAGRNLQYIEASL